jgi:hypothetical protein
MPVLAWQFVNVVFEVHRTSYVGNGVFFIGSAADNTGFRFLTASAPWQVARFGLIQQTRAKDGALLSRIDEALIGSA